VFVTTDPNGVALAAIQGLNAELEELRAEKDAEIEELQAANEALLARMHQLEERMRR
jgi:FtsZ-binding cell division protein ZapB